jgi:hypothetical protein
VVFDPVTPRNMNPRPLRPSLSGVRSLTIGTPLLVPAAFVAVAIALMGHTARGKEALVSASDCASVPICASTVCLTCSGNFGLTGIMNAVRVEQSATTLPGGRILLAGGDVGTTTSSTAEIYDPVVGVFLPNISLVPPPPGGTMTTQRFFHTATLLLNGKVLITGGEPPRSSKKARP